MTAALRVRLRPEERVESFRRRFPNYLAPSIHNGALYTTWIIGNQYGPRRNFRPSRGREGFADGNGYYGQYPQGLKDRVLSLFPDCEKVAHLFSGTVADPGVVTYDINPDVKPTILDDIRNVTAHIDLLGDVDLFVADPYYDRIDFEVVGQEPFDKRVVLTELAKVAKAGSYLAWLDTRPPQFSGATWDLLGYLGVILSAGTRIRCLTLLERLE